MHDRLLMERDSVERESREKETKILSLNNQLEELQARLAESDRVRAQQQRDLDSYANSQDDVGKNVRSVFAFWHRVCLNTASKQITADRHRSAHIPEIVWSSVIASREIINFVHFVTVSDLLWPIVICGVIDWFVAIDVCCDLQLICSV